jgi:CheY-like chemotaxis protein
VPEPNPASQNDVGQDRISLLAIEDNEYMLDVLANSLKGIGFTRVQKARNGREAIEYLKLTAKSGGAVDPVDIVISDLVMSPINGLHVLQWLRDDPGSPNRFMPFIMLSGAADRQNVEEARARGVNDFLGKPFAVDHLYKALQRIIDAPRQFVVTHDFFGPDRRRSNKVGPPSSGERRRPNENHATIVRSKDRVLVPQAPSEVWLFKLPNYLRTKMGLVGGKQTPFVLPQNVLAAAEQQLKRQAEGFVGWTKGYLDRIAKKAALAKTLSGGRADVFEEINLVAHEMRGQGGTFGYPLITVFGKSLYDATKAPCRQDDAALQMVTAHIDAMRAVLRDKISGDGGEVGRQLFKALKAEIERLSVTSPPTAQ